MIEHLILPSYLKKLNDCILDLSISSVEVLVSSRDCGSKGGTTTLSFGKIRKGSKGGLFGRNRQMFLFEPA